MRPPKSVSSPIPKKEKKLLFDNDIARQSLDEVGQKKFVVVVGGETLADRDMTNYEWAMTMSGTCQSLWEASTSDDAPGGNVL